MRIGNFDWIIQHGMVVDGTGNPWFQADIGIRDGKIIVVGDLSTATAERVLNIAGLVVTPGFIDIHNHSDVALLLQPQVSSHIMQGVTTLVIGNCGCSAAPINDISRGVMEEWDVIDGHDLRALGGMGTRWSSMDEYLAIVEQRGVAANVAALVGHGNIRAGVLGGVDRPPIPDELVRMQMLTSEAMEQGAFGISFGLMYAPGFFSNIDELIAVARIVHQHNGFVSVHMRDESDRESYLQSVQEVIAFGLSSGAPVQISHLETHYPNWGMQAEILDLLDEARMQGLDVTCDVPPYILGGTSLAAALPDWVQDGGFARALERLQNPDIRRRILEDRTSKRGIPGQLLLGGHWDKMWVDESSTNPSYTGNSLAQIAALRGEEPSWNIVMDLLVEEQGDIGINATWHNEEDIRTLVSHPLCMIESDSSAVISKTRAANPRAFGAFPLVFRKYVRGETRHEEPREPGKKILTLQEAVRKMTSFPAQRLRLNDRGLLRQGMWADLVILDPMSIADETTYANPQRYPKGIEYVLVNGQMVVEHGKQTERLPGQVLRRK